MKTDKPRYSSFLRGSASALALTLGTIVPTAAARPTPQHRAGPRTWPLQPATAALLKQAVAARRGRVVVVNLWATWCPPCTREFPGLLKLQRRYGRRGVSVLFVAANDFADRNTKVEPFLRQHKTHIPVWIVSGDPGACIKGFDPRAPDPVGLPRTYIFDRHGKLVRVIAGEGKTYRQFRRLVRRWL